MHSGGYTPQDKKHLLATDTRVRSEGGIQDSHMGSWWNTRLLTVQEGLVLFVMSDVVRRVYGVDVVSWRNTGSNLSLPPSQDPIACCLGHGGTGGHDRMEQNSASFGMRKLALLHSVVVKFPVADAIKNILVLN